MASESTSLDLLLPDGGKYGFELHTISLTEGINLISCADLTVYSKETISLDTLRELVEKPAAVKISQTSDNIKTVRWHAGMITAVKHAGVVQENQSDGSFVCKFQLRLESPFASMKYARPRRHYTGAKAADVIADILKSYGIIDYACTASLSEESRNFYQGSNDDYDFLMRIFSEHRLSYMFVTQPLGENDSPVYPQLSLFTTEVKTPAQVIVDGNAVESSVVAFNYNTASESGDGNVMTAWEMNAGIGVDKVVVHYTDTGGKQTCEKSSAADSPRQYVFNGTPFSESVGSNVDTAAESLLRIFGSAKERWHGRTASLEAMPGACISLAQFTGDSTVFEALITSAVLKATGQCPAILSMADPPKPELNIDIECVEKRPVNPAESTTRHVRSFWMNALVRENNITAEKSAGAEQLGAGANDIELVEATVCDTSGKCDSKGGSQALLLPSTSSQGNYVFDALVDDQKVDVILTMPLGGQYQGLFRTPRIGDKILIMKDTKGKCYLHSYLPHSTEMPFASNLASADGEYSSAEMTALRHRDTGVLDEPERYGSEEIPSDTILASETNKPNTISEFAVYSKTAADPTLVNVASTGKLNLSSNDTTNIVAKNLTISAEQWKSTSANEWSEDNGNVNLTDVNNVTVEAAGSISFKVGTNSITITRSGIALRSSKFTSSYGPLDAAIFVDGMSGLSMYGLRSVITGQLGAVMNDAIGGALKISAGSASLTGGVASLKAASPFSVVVGGIKLVVEEIAQLCAQCGGNESAATQSVIVSTAAAGSAQHIAQIYGDILKCIGNTSKKDIAVHTCLIIVEVLNWIAELINSIWMAMDLWDNTGWMNSPVDGKDSKMTNRDALKLAALACILIAWVLALSVLGLKFEKNRRYAALKLKGGKIEQDCTNKNDLATEEEKDKTVAKTKDTTTQGETENLLES